MLHITSAGDLPPRATRCPGELFDGKEIQSDDIDANPLPLQRFDNPILAIHRSAVVIRIVESTIAHKDEKSLSTVSKFSPV